MEERLSIWRFSKNLSSGIFIRWHNQCITQTGVDILGRIENENQDVAEDGSIIRVKLPNRRAKEQFAQAELMLGSNHIKVRCSDGVTRLGRIKGKIKKRVWIREGDILIVIPWEFQDDKCDIVCRYTTPQVDWLRAHKYL